MGIKTIKNKHRSDRCKKYASLFGSGTCAVPHDRSANGLCLPQSQAKPAGFHSNLWQSPKPGGFRSMSSGKAQNPAGFAPCQVAEPKTRRVSLYVEWQSPKPGGFRSMSSGKAQNPAGFAPCRVAKPKTRRVSCCTVWRISKLAEDGAPHVRLNASLTSKSIQAPYRCRNGGECTNI